MRSSNLAGTMSSSLSGSRPTSSSIIRGGANTNTNNNSNQHSNHHHHHHHKQVEFAHNPSRAGSQPQQSQTEQKIIAAVERLQDLVNQEAKWRNRVISSVNNNSSVDLSMNKMNDYIAQCQKRIEQLREEAAKVADKQMHLVSFEPNVYKQWFEQLGADPCSIQSNPTVVASCNAALSGTPGGLEGSLRGGGKSKMGGSKRPGGGGKNSSVNPNQPPQQYLDGIPLPQNFWKRRDQQRQALAAVYLAIFDLPRLNREKPLNSSFAKPTTSAEMVFQLQEAVRLSASGPQQLREVLREYRIKEREVQTNTALQQQLQQIQMQQSMEKSKGGGAGKMNAAQAQKLAQQQVAAAQAAAAQQRKEMQGGNNSGRGARPGSSPAGGKHGKGSGAVGGHHSGLDADINGEPITAKSCLQTGVFIHDPNTDDLALSTDLRAGDFFDIGSPRCLDQRILHRVVTLRSRRLRLEECIAVFEEEKKQLLNRKDVQNEMKGLSQYSLFATRPEIDRTVAEEKQLQKQRQDEILAAQVAEKQHARMLQQQQQQHGSFRKKNSSSDSHNNAQLDEAALAESTGNMNSMMEASHRSKGESASAAASPQASRRRM